MYAQVVPFARLRQESCVARRLSGQATVLSGLPVRGNGGKDDTKPGIVLVVK
ncbi:hypothetical protein [Streptosporangium sp. KLBMP 9127]|nr:hypothetical protein [Streptosporangium sp. KLBMP 9127]